VAVRAVHTTIVHTTVHTTGCSSDEWQAALFSDSNSIKNQLSTCTWGTMGVDQGASGIRSVTIPCTSLGSTANGYCGDESYKWRVAAEKVLDSQVKKRKRAGKGQEKVEKEKKRKRETLRKKKKKKLRVEKKTTSRSSGGAPPRKYWIHRCVLFNGKGWKRVEKEKK
jgi:hypothetical protein